MHHYGIVLIIWLACRILIVFKVNFCVFFISLSERKHFVTSALREIYSNIHYVLISWDNNDLAKNYEKYERKMLTRVASCQGTLSIWIVIFKIDDEVEYFKQIIGYKQWIRLDNCWAIVFIFTEDFLISVWELEHNLFLAVMKINVFLYIKYHVSLSFVFFVVIYLR